MQISSHGEIEPFITLDGSEIREWAGRAGHMGRAARAGSRSVPAHNQSLAEATIPVGGATTAHYHRLTEELYLVTAGRGRLIVDGEERVVGEGDCALIPPGATHKLHNIGDRPLRIVCACSPAYSDEDTCLTE